MGETLKQNLELLKKGLDLASKRGSFDLEESSTLLSAYVKVVNEVQVLLQKCEAEDCAKEENKSKSTKK
jgi:hypothetical protein